MRVPRGGGEEGKEERERQRGLLICPGLASAPGCLLDVKDRRSVLGGNALSRSPAGPRPLACTQSLCGELPVQPTCTAPFRHACPEGAACSPLPQTCADPEVPLVEDPSVGSPALWRRGGSWAPVGAGTRGSRTQSQLCVHPAGEAGSWGLKGTAEAPRLWDDLPRASRTPVREAHAALVLRPLVLGHLGLGPFPL